MGRGLWARSRTYRFGITSPRLVLSLSKHERFDGEPNNPTGLKEPMASYGSPERCLPAVRCESLTKIRIAPSAPHHNYILITLRCS
jgi:hypothetical protein